MRTSLMVLGVAALNAVGLAAPPGRAAGLPTSPTATAVAARDTTPVSAVSAPSTSDKPTAATDTLGFEVRGSGRVPGGWSGRPEVTISLDSTTVHSGRFAARIERDERSPFGGSSLWRTMPVTAGDSLELRGWLAMRHVEGFAGLSLRENAQRGLVSYDDMMDRNLVGSRPWTEYRVVLPLEADPGTPVARFRSRPRCIPRSTRSV